MAPIARKKNNFFNVSHHWKAKTVEDDIKETCRYTCKPETIIIQEHVHREMPRLYNNVSMST